MQCESFAVQRGKPRAMSIMIKKRKDKSTYKKRQTKSAFSKRYATKQPDAKFPGANKKMGTYVTANRVGIESIVISATRLNPKLPHHLKPLPHLKGKEYGYNKLCSLCRWATGNKYMVQLSYCEYFSTVLCVWCNKSWHIFQNLAGLNYVLGREIILRKNSKGNTKIGRFNVKKSWAFYAFSYCTLVFIYIVYAIFIDCIHTSISIPLRPKI